MIHHCVQSSVEVKKDSLSLSSLFSCFSLYSLKNTINQGRNIRTGYRDGFQSTCFILRMNYSNIRGFFKVWDFKQVIKLESHSTPCTRHFLDFQPSWIKQFDQALDKSIFLRRADLSPNQEFWSLMLTIIPLQGQQSWYWVNYWNLPLDQGLLVVLRVLHLPEVKRNENKRQSSDKIWTHHAARMKGLQYEQQLNTGCVLSCHILTTKSFWILEQAAQHLWGFSSPFPISGKKI